MRKPFLRVAVAIPSPGQCVLSAPLPALLSTRFGPSRLRACRPNASQPAWSTDPVATRSGRLRHGSRDRGYSVR